MTAERLSALDASFLAVETAAAPMHIGWVAAFDAPEAGPSPRFAELAEHIAGRLERAPRYRQRLASVPFGLHDPVWVDDPGFDSANHLLPAEGGDLSALADSILSTPLRRDRPLWEMWIADSLPGGRIAIVGKAHHCMVDGAAVVELGNALFDPEPDVPARGRRGGGWAPVPGPSAGERLARAVVDRAADGAALALTPVRLASAPARLPGLASRSARTLAHTLLPPAPSSPLNRQGSPRRHHVRLTRSLGDLRTVRRRFGVSPNDVVLAACAGGLRRFAERRGETPQSLKVMVPADVRSSTDAAGSGNRISFTFMDLPCDDPDPRAASPRSTARPRSGRATARPSTSTPPSARSHAHRARCSGRPRTPSRTRGCST